MANKILIGENWNTSGDWSPVNEPGAGDDIFVSESKRDITTGDQGGADFNSINIPRTYVGSFGATGAPLFAAANKVVYRGTGGFYYGSDAGGTTLRTDLYIIDAANRGVRVELGSNPADPGANGEYYLVRGNVLLPSNTVFDANSAVYVGPDVDATLAAGMSVALPVLTTDGGSRSKCSSVVTALRMSGGEHTQDTAKIVRGDIFAGTLIYNHIAVSGDASVFVVHPGASIVFDATGVPKTVTTVVLMPDAMMYPSYPDGKNLTVTNFYDLRRN